jgi:hypothetical protein
LRDWDTQVGASLVVSLATAYLLIAAWRSVVVERSALPVCATALVAGLALWGIHSSAIIGERRLATLLRDRAAWNRGEWSRAHEFVGTREFNAGRFAEAARDYEIAVAGAPNPRLVANLAVSLGMAGRVEDSERMLARAMAMPQRTTTMWVELGRLALTIGDTARAMVCVDSIQARQRIERAGRVPGTVTPGPERAP